LHAVPAYQADMAAVRDELSRQPVSPPSACTEEAKILHP
jgi:hypothetical protein